MTDQVGGGMDNYACPVDGLPLLREANTLRCAKAHSFDLAKQGYFNLLLVQQKASKEPGDSQEMVMARRRFLDSGAFEPVADFLLENVRKTNAKGLRIVDAGCGEGYYLRHLRAKGPTDWKLGGFDISKPAVLAAAKASRGISWVVASNRNPPFLESDLILSLFGFPVWESFSRILPVGGQVLIADPAENHLIELRKIIYPEVRLSEPPSLASAWAAGFKLQDQDRLTFSVTLASQAQIQDLLAMTPHAYRLSKEGALALSALTELRITVDIMFRRISLIVRG